jgi:Zn-dependent protease
MNDDETPELPLPDDEADAPIDSRHAAVLAAMNQIQNRQPSWTRAIILFVVSLTLFVGAGAFAESMQFIGILVGVLFIHELGHYLAMGWFGYRNVRMFFIPFFGAAVSGQHFDVAGWKKIIVSLLGPVPGIGLGILLGSFAIFLKQNPETVNLSHELLLQIATVSILINGFNLLPILPLDGGWIMHALVFCRHPIFDAGFRLLASLSMLLLGAMFNAWFFLFIGGFLLLGIPVTYRMAKLARRLKREGVQREAEPDGNIPPETATRIIEGVEMATRHAATPQIVATHSLQVFETLNATPPGVIASFLFAAVHGLALFVAVVAGSVLTIEQQSSFEEFVELAMSAPQYSYICETAETWKSANWVPGSADEKLLLVAHRSTTHLAADEFTKLSGAPPAAGKLTRFGQTLLVDVKDAKSRDAWETRLLAGGGVLPRGRVSVRVHCSLPSVKRAEKSMQDCKDYIKRFVSPDWLVPPWSHPENLTDAGLEQRRLARRIFQRVRDQEQELGADASVGESFAKNIAKTALTNDQQRVDELTEQLRKEQLANLTNAIKELRSSVSNPVENQVLDLMLKHELVTPFGFEPIEPPPEFAELLGQFDRNAEGQISFEDAASRCFDVEAKQAAFLLAIEVESFESTTVGITRLSQWLCKQGTGLIQYDITTKPDPLAINN